MSCGLGAVILLLILIKQQPAPSPVDTDMLQKDLQQLQTQQEQLSRAVQALTRETGELLALTMQTAAENARNRQAVAASRQDSAQAQSQLEELKERIEKAPPAHRADVVEQEAAGEENYLFGLKVEGRRIVILLDHSASMTDRTLVDIIRRKASGETQKKQGPKWQRSIRIVRWLLARLPAGSEALVMGFSDKAAPLGPAAWFSAKDAAAISRVYADLEALVPAAATNLQAGLQAARNLRPAATAIYLVTDGLPTRGLSNYKSLNPFADCSSLLGNAATISGPCRVKLFRQTVRDAGPGRGIPVNVILLPLEGDPDAAGEFWAWAFSSGGLMMTPAESWP